MTQHVVVPSERFPTLGAICHNSTLQSPSVRCCLHSVRWSSEEITGYVVFYFEEEEEEEKEEEEREEGEE